MLGRFKGWFSALSLIGKVGVISAASIASIGIAGAATHPQTQTTKTPSSPPVVQADKIEHKTIITTENIPFDTKTVNDSTLAIGTDKIQTEGVNGVKTKTWDQTLTNGVETNRTLVKEEITTQPVSKVIAHGTYVAPAPAPSQPQPPVSAYRIGAICSDGSSSSATGSGACSHHQGVSCWKYSDGSCRAY